MSNGQLEAAHQCTKLLLAHYLYRAVIIAVTVIGKVQMTIDKVVHVIAVRHCLMTAVRAVSVTGVMALTGMAVGALSRIGRSHRKSMLINVPFMLVVQVTVMEIIDVIVMLNRNMAAVGTVCMGMIFVNFVSSCHDDVLFWGAGCLVRRNAFRCMCQPV